MRRRGYMFQATKMADVNLKGDYSNVDNSPIVKDDGGDGSQYETVFEETLVDILQELTPILHKADDMATALRIPPSKLLVERRPTMKDVIRAWLNQHYNVQRHGPPSWQLLIKAVADDVGGANRALANRIAKKHIGIAPIAVCNSQVVQPAEESIDEKRSQRSISVTSTSSTESSNYPLSHNSSTSSFASYPMSESSLGGSSGTCICTKGQVFSTISSTTSSCGEGVEGNREDDKLPPLTEEESGTPDTISGDDSRPTDTDGLFRKTPKLSKKFSTLPSLQPYKMKPSNGYHGYVLVINVIHVHGHDIREGAEFDDERLVKTFKTLGYRLYGNKSHRNLKADEIRHLTNEVASTDHSQYNSVVVCLLSHGGAGFIYGSDGIPIQLGEIRQFFVHSPTLPGKPKLFFIQSCRGRQLPPARTVQTDDDEDDGSSHRILLPQQSDIFFGYATTLDTKACRFTDEGSWYVIELCKSLDAHYKELDLLTMVQIAHYEITHNPQYVYQRVDRIYRQAPQMVSTLTHPLHFVS